MHRFSASGLHRLGQPVPTGPKLSLLCHFPAKPRRGNPPKLRALSSEEEKEAEIEARKFFLGRCFRMREETMESTLESTGRVR
jgi:hypothetical protein